MRFYVHTVAALAALTLTLHSNHGGAEDNSDEPVISRLQGRWEIVSGVNQGRELTDREVAGTYVTITTNSIVTYDQSDQARYQAVFTVNEEEEPVQIIMRAVAAKAPTQPRVSDQDAPADITAASGILKFENSTSWILCYALPGGVPPKAFESPDGSKVMLFKLKRKQGDPIPSLQAK